MQNLFPAKARFHSKAAISAVVVQQASFLFSVMSRIYRSRFSGILGGIAVVFCLFSSVVGTAKSATVNKFVILFGGTHGFSYYPNTLAVEVGDTIEWQGDFATLPLLSTSVPAGAKSYGPINTGSSYMYVVGAAGTYNFQNNIYASVGMKGSFTAVFKPHGSLTNEGREFYLGILFPTYNYVAFSQIFASFKMYALITTYYDNEVTVAYPDGLGGDKPTNPVKIAARHMLQVQLDVNAMRMDSFPETPSYRALHITSKYPVAVRFLSVGANSGGGYLAIPVLSLGKNYVVASYNDNAGYGALYGINGAPNTYDVAGGTFMVIATEAGTSVQITPTTTTSGGHTGAKTGAGANGKARPFTVGLEKGQCYVVRSNGKDQGQDISGTLVEATKPVVVIAGHEDGTLGGVSPYTMDARDFMIEQMIPYETWDSVGYVSIPFHESTPYGQEGHGDSYRVYSFDSTSATVKADVVGIGGSYTLNTTRLASPAAEHFDITTPVDIYSTGSNIANAKKISVMQYDERSQGTKAPYPCPSMCTVIPYSRWRKTCNFSEFDPSDISGVTDPQYVNVISDSLNAIRVSVDGAPDLPISAAFTQLGTNNFISSRYSIKGARYSVGSHSYHVFSDFPFNIYMYGMKEYQYYYGIFQQQNFESEYASPAGFQLNTGVTPSFKVTIDTMSNCSGWTVCIIDTGKNDPGVRAVMLVDDTNGVYFDRPGAKFKNVTFDTTSLDYYQGELHPHFHAKSQYCFDIKIPNRIAAASAPIGLIDNYGNGMFIRLVRSAPSLKITTLPVSTLKPDSIYFPQQKVGAEICTTFVYKNTSLTGGEALDFLAATLKKNDKTFTIKSVSPPFPCSILPQDSLVIQLCYLSEDTLRHRDTLVVTNDCFSVTSSLDARSATGLISAEDVDFGVFQLGDQSCKNIQIHNVGSLPFSLTRTWRISDSVNFSLDQASIDALPVSVSAGKTSTLKVCYHPQASGPDSARKDTARIYWGTDLDPKFANSTKDHSIITGIVIQKKASVETKYLSDAFTIRPNPATGNSAIVTFASVLAPGSSIGLFDVLGKEIYTKDNLYGLQRLEIPLQNIGKGIYYIRLTSGNTVFTRKFEVVK